MSRKAVILGGGQSKWGVREALVTFEIPAIPIEKGKQGIVMAERYFFAFEPVK